MTASETLRLARQNGIHVGVSGADLILDAEREPASAVLDALRRHKAEIVALLAPDDDAWSAKDWLAFFDEHVRSEEMDGGHSPEQAEALAFECCVVEWLDRHSCKSDPGRCAACGRPDRERGTVVPFGTESHGHIWLHPECWSGWHEGRRAEAAAALEAMGIAKPAKSPNDFGKSGSA